MMTIVGMALGGWLSGEIFDLTGSYTAAFTHGIAWNVLNLVIALWLLLPRLPARMASAERVRYSPTPYAGVQLNSKRRSM